MIEPSKRNTRGTLHPPGVCTQQRRIAVRDRPRRSASADPRDRSSLLQRSPAQVSLMRSRMREIRTSGSVRGEGGNPLAYSTSELSSVKFQVKRHARGSRWSDLQTSHFTLQTAAQPRQTKPICCQRAGKTIPKAQGLEAATRQGASASNKTRIPGLGILDCAKPNPISAKHPEMGTRDRGREAPSGDNCAKQTQFPAAGVSHRSTVPSSHHSSPIPIAQNKPNLGRSDGRDGS